MPPKLRKVIGARHRKTSRYAAVSSRLSPNIIALDAPPDDLTPSPSSPPPLEMQELNDKFKGEETDPNDEDPKRARFRRACHVISGAEGIGLAPLIRANHITGKAHLYNIAFVAQLLNRRPRIHRESLHLGASVKMQVGRGFGISGDQSVSTNRTCGLWPSVHPCEQSRQD